MPWTVLALDRAIGVAVWRYPLAARADAGQYGFAGSVAVGDGRVYVAATDGRVFAFGAASK